MSDKRRRKALTIPSQLKPMTPINEPSPSESSSPVSLLKKRRPPNIGSSETNAPSPTNSDLPSPNPSKSIEVRQKTSLDKLLSRNRPRSLQKSTRPSSIFGSWRSLPQTDEDNSPLTKTASQASSIHSYSEFLSSLAATQVLLHGEVQTASGVFRKRSQYLVLTETYLVKIRSQSQASEIFPSIPSSLGRASGVRHSRLSSNGSIHDLQPQAEGLQAIPLNQIVAAYRLDDGKPYFSIEVAYLDEEVLQTSNLILQLYDPKDHDLWLSSIRGAAMNARLKDPTPFSQYLVEYAARTLEQEQDYDPLQFHMFRIVQRANKSGGARSSTDDLTKLTSNICILAVGVFRMHIIPLPKNGKALSSTSLADCNSISYGLASLTELTVSQEDDSFVLKFRIPLRQAVTIPLASSCVNDIALSTRRTADFLRPKWPEQPFTWNVPKIMDEDDLPLLPIDEDHEAFDRTLAAYCAAYGCDVSLMRYTVSHTNEDGPTFALAPRADGRRYTILDLLAIFRALRYNESFGTLSFADTALDELHKLRDPFGFEHVAWRTRSGEQLRQDEEKNATLLVQEVRALALNSVSLRRLDFSHCLSIQSIGMHDRESDNGCGICEGLFPMCARHATNVDWITLNGIALTELDMDYFFSTAIDRSCHFRAIDVGHCGLTERSMHTVLNALSHQTSTLESLDLSGNPGRLDVQNFNIDLLSFNFLRRILLSKISRTTSPEALLSAEVLIRWNLEEIALSGTALNAESVDALATYLQSAQSSSLKILNVDECQLSGHDAATLFQSSSVLRDQVRQLSIDVSSNRLEVGHDALVDTIRQGKCPSHITMRMIDYQDELHYRRLLDALTINTTITYLDISKTTLPSDASQETCESLGRLFTFNSTLKHLDISGEQTHLVASNLGPGLNSTLICLKHNTSIEVFRIEKQRLGLQGASTLATVLEANKVMRELYCENNEVNLQAFTMLVNSLEHNKVLLYFPDMVQDRVDAQRKVDREVDSMRDNTNISSGPMSSTRATVKRTLGRTVSGQKTNLPKPGGGPIPAADLMVALGSLSDRWEQELVRAHRYLSRNHKLAEGLPLDVAESLDLDAPKTSSSLERAMRGFSLEGIPPADGDGHLQGRENGTIIEDEKEDADDHEADDMESPLEMKR